MKKDILIMGIGNYLMRDEGAGVHFVQFLKEHPLPFAVDIMDGGTGGFHLLEYFETYQKIIIVDATLDGQPAGTIQCIQPRYASDFPKAMSTHDIGLKDLVSVLQILDRMPEIILFTVSINSIQEQGTELNDDIKNIFPQLLNMIRILMLNNKVTEKSGAFETAMDRF